ncbi:MAG: nodulation protein NfeD [Ignavibacteriaceae bacterium]
MKLKTFLSFLLILLNGLNFSYSRSSQKVYYAKIESEIDLGLAPYISRVVSEAEKNNAAAIIFHINTFGGRVDAATQIKDAIISTKLLTIAFIKNRAISAGALIALSCKKIVMAPGSNIGAATVVDQAGQKVGEKYQSYMRSEMRSTAEKNGRRTDIAQGMVDERIVVDGLVDSTQLISLTTSEALKYKIADTTASSLDEVLAEFNLKNAEIININPNWAEDVVKFLNNPVVSSILIMLGFFGLIAEIKTPGWGLPGTMGVICLALFFGSSYVLQLATGLEIILFILGMILLALEIFVIPGFGIAGISGIILIVVSIFLSLVGDISVIDFNLISVAIIQLTAALVAALVLIFILAKYLPKNSAFSRLVLSEEETAEKGFLSNPTPKEFLGLEGIALTTLRPAGTADFDGKRVDVVTEASYIENGKKIRVIKVEGSKVIVREIIEKI